MKRIFTFLFLAAIIFQAQGQQVGLNNLGLNTWTTNGLGQPQPEGFASVHATENTSDPIEGSSALKLEVAYNSFLGDTLAASALGEVVGGGSIDVGEPYGECPDSLTGYFRYDLQNEDTAAIMAEVWTSSNDTLASAQTFIGGTQNGWTRFSLPFNPSNCNGMTPDTIGIYMSAETKGLAQFVSGIENRGTQTVGSVLEVDALYLHDATNTSVLSLKDEQAEYSVQPNPAQERVRFDLGSRAERIRIYDMTGRNIKTVQCGSSNSRKVDLSNMEEGLYIYRVEDLNGKKLHTDKLQVVR